MKKEEMIQKAYQVAAERYAAVGVDVEKALARVMRLPPRSSVKEVRRFATMQSYFT